MKVSFPAMQGTIGQRTYYSCLMKLNAIPKMFTFRDWAEFTPEEREQRILNKKRVPDIAKYILDNEDGYLFASITASYKCTASFNAVIADRSLGLLEMDFEDANFVINDGQHRCAAIAHAIKENPAVGEETISVLLFPYESRERVQQMFSDLNRFVVKTSKSLDILFDKRDPLSIVTLEVCELVPAFKGMVDKDAMSLPIRSPKLFSLSALYDANEELLRDFRVRDAAHPELVSVATEYWTAIAKVMPAWAKVKSGDLKALELRQENISSHAVVLRALGAVGAELMQQDPTAWKGRLVDLLSVDWRKKNPDWENVCIIANSVVSNRQARFATKAYIKQKLGLVLNEAEARAVTKPKLDAILRDFLKDDGPDTPGVKVVPSPGTEARGQDTPAQRGAGRGALTSATRGNAPGVPPVVHSIGTTIDPSTRGPRRNAPGIPDGLEPVGTMVKTSRGVGEIRSYNVRVEFAEPPRANISMAMVKTVDPPDPAWGGIVPVGTPVVSATRGPGITREIFYHVRFANGKTGNVSWKRIVPVGGAGPLGQTAGPAGGDPAVVVTPPFPFPRP